MAINKGRPNSALSSKRGGGGGRVGCAGECIGKQRSVAGLQIDL